MVGLFLRVVTRTYGTNPLEKIHRHDVLHKVGDVPWFERGGIRNKMQVINIEYLPYVE